MIRDKHITFDGLTPFHVWWDKEEYFLCPLACDIGLKVM